MQQCSECNAVDLVILDEYEYVGFGHDDEGEYHEEELELVRVYLCNECGTWTSEIIYPDRLDEADNE